MPLGRGPGFAYNSPVPDSGPNPRHARVRETLGLILIALLIFVVTLARFAKSIHWSWR